MSENKLKFAVVEEKHPRYTFYRIIGSLSADNTHDIRANLLEKAKSGNILIDMSEVDMLASTGVGLLFELSDQMTRSGNQLVLINPSSRVQQVISLTGFTNMFLYEKNLEGAERRLN